VNEKELRRYLEDHTSGAEVGLAIARRLGEKRQGTEIATFMTKLTNDIEEEQRVVQGVMEGLPAEADPLRQAVGVVGHLGRLAGRLPFMPEPTLVEDLEALAIGVWGKRLLWGALARVAESNDIAPGGDLDELAERAEEQERVILRLRQDALVDLFDLETA
jgi:hypothetical protein